ncbi:MAG TPA: hypothetical protein PKB01_07130 [Xanthobacteraceae bacterium]|nr:hypothetical protein [Xanthobacteraceae bacterium]
MRRTECMRRMMAVDAEHTRTALRKLIRAGRAHRAKTEHNNVV